MKARSGRGAMGRETRMMEVALAAMAAMVPLVRKLSMSFFSVQAVFREINAVSLRRRICCAPVSMSMTFR